MPDNLNRIDDKLRKFVLDINQGKLWGSYEIAYKTVDLLKDVITHGNWKTAQELVDLVSTEGKKLTKSLPLQASVANMVRRMLKIIREEYVAMRQDKQEEVDPQESLHKIVTAEGDVDDYSKPLPDLKESILEHVGEFEMELETSADNIAEQALQHIHSNEIIMTIGKSASVEAFLKKAATKRKFEVIVAEGAPFCLGHELAVSLGKSKIQTTLIADSAIFAIMSRVNKVIIGTHTVMANGGLRAVSGSHIMAMAANHYSVPVRNNGTHCIFY
ncbi:Translation initiation factor eIF-2B subunit beta [Blattella germanica]|nr:Translation initiation factor eIF-2B subunit beta [Blattella germanica]